jgi:hypothetical protein
MEKRSRNPTGPFSARVGHECALLVLLHRIQAAAKQKYARREAVKPQNCFNGERLNPNEAVLHQNAFSIADLLSIEAGTDLDIARNQLPGIGFDLIDQLRAMIGLPPAGAPPPAAAAGTPVPVPPDAPADRAEHDRLIKEIDDRRNEVQFGIGCRSPYTDPVIATAHRRFDLPLSRPFDG